MEVKQRLDVLEQRLQTLRIDYERFLSGGLDVPPEQMEETFGRAVRDLRVASLTAAEGFRLSSIEARFNSYRERFRKRMRDAEIGLRPRLPVELGVKPDPIDGVTVSNRVGDDWAAVLFQGLYGHTGAPAIDLDSFHRYLERQVATLRERHGCSLVRLRLVERDGKMTLRAKPVRSDGTET